MKVLLINGSPKSNGCTYTGLKEVAKALKENNIETEIFHIGKEPISGCMACGACKKLGKCVIDDKVNELTSRLDQFDGIIVGSPVYYSNASGQIRSFLDRMFYSGGGAKLQGKPGAAIVSCRRGGASASFDEINKYFTISNMPVVPSNYWNQIHGNTPEEVLKDEEGLQTLRQLGHNMAWLLGCIEAGKEKGLTFKSKETKIRTNFIR
ncbi:MAG: flavodoxin family protein [Oscillospiraceae bacterium]|nr:flavodoxin family protein [Oscillospiraceae bacterium]